MKTIRLWHGCTVVGVVSVGDKGCTFTGGVGGAHNSGKVDIEMDPWAGLIVDHSTENPPISWRDQEA